MKRTFVLVLLATGACAHAPVPVADAELAAITGKGLEAVEAARKDEVSTRQAIEARRLELSAALREIRIAEQASRRDEADFEVARLRFEGAQETKDAEAMLPANDRRAKAERAMAASQAEVPYRQASRAYAEARLREAEAAHDVSMAQLERAKVTAVIGDGTPLPSQEERRAGFDAQVAKAQARLADAAVKVARAKGDLQVAEQQWKAAVSGTPVTPSPAPASAVPASTPKP
jgi:hypothetical protein